MPWPTITQCWSYLFFFLTPCSLLKKGRCTLIHSTLYKLCTSFLDRVPSQRSIECQTCSLLKTHSTTGVALFCEGYLCKCSTCVPALCVGGMKSRSELYPWQGLPEKVWLPEQSQFQNEQGFFFTTLSFLHGHMEEICREAILQAVRGPCAIFFGEA